MQYSLLVFEIVFTGLVISWMVLIRGWAGGRGWGGVVGVGGKPEVGYPVIRAQTVVLCSQQTTGMYTLQDISRLPLAAVWHTTNSD